jgi:hypothetical protein
MKIEEIATAQLATVTGGTSCDDLRGISGRFAPQDLDERRAAQLCLQDGEPFQKKVR